MKDPDEFIAPELSLFNHLQREKEKYDKIYRIYKYEDIYVNSIIFITFYY